MQQLMDLFLNCQLHFLRYSIRNTNKTSPIKTYILHCVTNIQTNKVILESLSCICEIQECAVFGLHVVPAGCRN